MSTTDAAEATAGVDEVGRGPLAGPVYAAAVILDRRRPIAGLTDSKLLSPARRTELAARIRSVAVAFALGRAEVEEIDALDIRRATLLAMQRAVMELGPMVRRVLVDGRDLPELPWPARAIVGGDRSVPAISAASIIAKVARDEEMCRLDALHPGYGLAQHKGYPTPAHLAALAVLGPSAVHRRSFAPVAALVTGRRRP